MIAPEIRIQHSWLLSQTVSPALQKKHDPEDKSKATKDDYEKWAGDYRAAWKKSGDKILTGMQECLDLKFRQQIIDVSLAPWLQSISSPLIINFRSEPDHFVDILTHELFHILLTDNDILTTRNGDEAKSKLNFWSLFGEDEMSFTTLVHIPVHAGCKYIYLDTLNEPYRLERDIEDVKKWDDYRLAWEYVEKHGYKEILEKTKQLYKTLAKD